MLIKWHTLTGYRQYQRTKGVYETLEAGAERVAAAAGGEEAGFVVDIEQQTGSRRVPRASVRTATMEARLAEARHRTLTKALDAGRGV